MKPIFDTSQNERLVLLDMDGTIANIYKDPQWLDRINKCDVSLFSNAPAMVSPKKLKEYLTKYNASIIVLTMTPWGASTEYSNKVAKAKLEWINGIYPFLSNNLMVIGYKDNKNEVKPNEIILNTSNWAGIKYIPNLYSNNAVLIDDNPILRNDFNGLSIAPPWNNGFL